LVRAAIGGRRPIHLDGCSVFLERGTSMEDRFDLVVIGAGPAGEKGAAQAAV
jgi:hypothetical protein